MVYFPSRCFFCYRNKFDVSIDQHSFWLVVFVDEMNNRLKTLDKIEMQPLLIQVMSNITGKHHSNDVNDHLDNN